MGGYVFLAEDGTTTWRLNLSGSIIWYGLLEELFQEELTRMTRKEHNWGHLWDASRYRQLAYKCIAFLQSKSPLPSATDAYRRRRGEDMPNFKKGALDIFQTSLRCLPEHGRMFVVDDLSTDWRDEPCECETCITEGHWKQVLEWYGIQGERS